MTYLLIAAAFTTGLVFGMALLLFIQQRRAARARNLLACDRCDTIVRRAELLDGEACPKCRLVGEFRLIHPGVDR